MTFPWFSVVAAASGTGTEGGWVFGRARVEGSIAKDGRRGRILRWYVTAL